MNTIYIIVGSSLILFGGWQTIKRVRNLINEKNDILGANYELLGVGIAAVISGIIIIIQHI